ncbi:MAG: hypothetical protein K2N82_08595, partial [Lachnospiraceae bacterium]|nr:hypothetical protein [Lachnospiraceae bacterium]
QRDFTADFQNNIQVCRAPSPSQKEVFSNDSNGNNCKQHFNDVSFIIDSRLSLYEHQSTYSPNLPLRY